MEQRVFALAFSIAIIMGIGPAGASSLIDVKMLNRSRVEQAANANHAKANKRIRVGLMANSALPSKISGDVVKAAELNKTGAIDNNRYAARKMGSMARIEDTIVSGPIHALKTPKNFEIGRNNGNLIAHGLHDMVGEQADMSRMSDSGEMDIAEFFGFVGGIGEDLDDGISQYQDDDIFSYSEIQQLDENHIFIAMNAKRKAKRKNNNRTGNGVQGQRCP